MAWVTALPPKLILSSGKSQVGGPGWCEMLRSVGGTFMVQKLLVARTGAFSTLRPHIQGSGSSLSLSSIPSTHVSHS